VNHIRYLPSSNTTVGSPKKLRGRVSGLGRRSWQRPAPWRAWRRAGCSCEVLRDRTLSTCGIQRPGQNLFPCRGHPCMTRLLRWAQRALAGGG
jgi:hypothetical protein